MYKDEVGHEQYGLVVDFKDDQITVMKLTPHSSLSPHISQFYPLRYIVYSVFYYYFLYL